MREFKYDFFLSRRGRVKEIAQEVASVLSSAGLKSYLQNVERNIGDIYPERMHDALCESRHLLIIFTPDYLESPHTRDEFFNFHAIRRKPQNTDRSIAVLIVEPCKLDGMLAGIVYGDISGVKDAERRKQIILDVVQGRAGDDSDGGDATPRRNKPSAPETRINIGTINNSVENISGNKITYNIKAKRDVHLKE